MSWRDFSEEFHLRTHSYLMREAVVYHRDNGGVAHIKAAANWREADTTKHTSCRSQRQGVLAGIYGRALSPFEIICRRLREVCSHCRQLYDLVSNHGGFRKDKREDRVETIATRFLCASAFRVLSVYLHPDGSVGMGKQYFYIRSLGPVFKFGRTILEWYVGKS